MIRAVLFDLDGTLLNRDESVKQFINGQYERLNQYLQHIPKETYISRFIRLDRRGYVWKDKVYQQLIEEFAISLTWEALLEDYMSHFKYHCVPFPNLVKLLEKLKSEKVILGIITNGKGQFQMDNIQALGIEHYFTTILISECEKLRKPDSKIFKRALEKLNVDANESIFVGDHPKNDVQAAQSVGMHAIWKKDFQWQQVASDFMIDDLLEIPSLISKINKLRN